MTALSAYLKVHATGRAVATALILAFLLYLIQFTLLIPHFRALTGFAPLDVQFPLTRYMVAIQLGAYDARTPLAYLPFVLVDQVLNVVTAVAIMLLWSWLFREQPNKVFDFLERGAVILIPVYALLFDFAENVLFARLIGGLDGEAYVNGIKWAVTAHTLRGAFLDLQVLLTILFVILFGLTAAKRDEAQGAGPGEP